VVAGSSKQIDLTKNGLFQSDTRLELSFFQNSDFDIKSNCDRVNSKWLMK
jgi:retron-type reverse transcriptase